MSVYDTMTPAQRSARARLAAHSLHAQHDPRETTAAATAASLARFEREVDPGGTLDPAERARRAHHALRAHMLRLALASARARRERKGGTGAAAARPQAAPPLAFPTSLAWHEEVRRDRADAGDGPTPGQLSYLHALGYRGTPPRTLGEADYLIERLNREDFADQVHAVEDEP